MENGRPKNCGGCKKPKRPKGTKYATKEGYCKCGKPTVMTPETVAKLDQAFSAGLSDRKACAFAGVSLDALYKYQKKNPEYTERKAQLKMNPDITARMTVTGALHDVGHAWKWLQIKDPEFMPTSKQIIEDNSVADLTEDMSPEEKEAIVNFRKARRERIRQMAITKSNESVSEQKEGEV